MSSTPPDPKTAIDRAPPVERAVWGALQTVEDPELPVSIVDLGLIYGVSVTAGTVTVKMTLTYSGCPAREVILEDVRTAVLDLEPIDEVEVSLVYSPPWSTDRITPAGREALAEWGMAVPERTPEGAACKD